MTYSHNLTPQNVIYSSLPTLELRQAARLVNVLWIMQAATVGNPSHVQRVARIGKRARVRFHRRADKVSN